MSKKPESPKTTAATTIVHIRLPPALAKELDEAAVKAYETRAGMAQYIIREWLKSWRERAGKSK